MKSRKTIKIIKEINATKVPIFNSIVVLSIIVIVLIIQFGETGL
jgi:hypothetical protein